MNKKKIRLNKYDAFVENLIKEFAKIPNLHLTSTDETGRNIFNLFTVRIAELSSYRTLFLNYYLKAASKAVADDLKEIRTSKYKNLISLYREELKENYYDTIRLGYIGLFHKYENFIDELIKMGDILCDDLDSKNSQSISEYSKKELNFKIKDWKFSSFIEHINWIAICNKHYDGYPKKTPRPARFNSPILYPENEKLKLTKEDFKRDSQAMITFYSSILRLVFIISMHKIAFENIDYEVYKPDNLEAYNELMQGKEESKKKIQNLISLYKAS